MRDFRHQRIIWVWIRQQRADGQQHFRDCQRRAPLFLENIKTDTSLTVNIWVVHLCLKLHFWRFKGIIRGKVNRHKEHASTVWTISGTHNSGLPVKQVISSWSSTTRGWRIPLQILRTHTHTRVKIDTRDQHFIFLFIPPPSALLLLLLLPLLLPSSAEAQAVVVVDIRCPVTPTTNHEGNSPAHHQKTITLPPLPSPESLFPPPPRPSTTTGPRLNACKPPSSLHYY